jgi:flavin-dependent dehydrogenase
MLSTEVVVAGGGVAGLLIATGLGSNHEVILLERRCDLPRNKYWLTDAESVRAVPGLESCVAHWCDALDFVAYDGLRATIRGRYALWDTDRLIDHLERSAVQQGVQLRKGFRLYSLKHEHDGITLRANSESIHARLLIDCMGVGSPIAVAKGIVNISGYYLLLGRQVSLSQPCSAVALNNVMLGHRPSYFELFPSSAYRAHASVILPSRSHRPGRSLSADFNFIVQRSHYSRFIDNTDAKGRPYSGIVPVGRLRTPALDRVVFFGEAGQTNPAASATGLTRMLRSRASVL